jgi:hypothetical protein
LYTEVENAWGVQSWLHKSLVPVEKPASGAKVPRSFLGRYGTTVDAAEKFRTKSESSKGWIGRG